MRPSILIVSPALAADNNGNWQTARRWARFLAPQARVAIARDWDGRPADLMIALHARRSAEPLRRFAQAGGPVVLVLTGTDLYRDIRTDAAAQRSLALAHRLVVLQERGVDELAAALHGKTVVIPQSAPALAPLPPRRRTFDLLLVGHLRPEKDPETALRALARLPAGQAPFERLRLLQVGGDRDADTAGTVRAAAARDARVALHGELPHTATRRLIRRGRVLLLPSRMEGGANVLIEAVTSGTPVLASRIGGSVGLLGADYDGFFPAGDDAALAALIRRCQAEPGFLAHLRAQCAARAAPFAPAAEAEAVRRLTHNLLDEHRRDAATGQTFVAPARRPAPPSTEPSR